MSRGVVGMDFCGDPYLGKYTKFKCYIDNAIRNGLKFTSHFAESPNEEDLYDILSSFPSRIGHASYMTDEIRQIVYDRKLPIESCLGSNINVMKLYGGVKDHPIIRWLEDGHPVALGSDNQGILGKNLSAHYQYLYDYGLSKRQLWELSKDCVNYIFDTSCKTKLEEFFSKNHPLNPYPKDYDT